MSLIPAFQIGVWNAWILVVPFILVIYGLCSLIVNKESPLFVSPVYDKKERTLSGIVMLTMVLLWAYSIFLPLSLGTAWLYAGLPLYVLGMAFVTIATLHFAGTAVDRPVTKGVFRISRHPMYFGIFLIYSGIGVACASWVFLGCSLLLVVLGERLAAPEERLCLERFGETYRDYMHRTPKWIGFPKSGQQ